MATHNEKVDMLLIYGECHKNSRRAAMLYRERYPERYVPDHKAFGRLERILRQNRDAFSSRKGKPIRKTVCDDHTVAVVVQYFEQNPRHSIRQACRVLDLKITSVQRILKANGFHDFKLHNLEYLTERHKELRINFITEVMLHMEITDRRLFHHILWTDESRFVSNGKPNRRNEHYWATENPHVVNEIQNQGHFGINVWCGMIGRHLVGPFFYEDILDGRRYLRFLQEDLPDLLEDVPLQLRASIWLQHDGAPPHRARDVKQYLDNTYGERWIGINGPTHWPSKSPDLTPLDFFLWGTLKNIVYKTPSLNTEHLKEKIRTACQSINRNTLRKTTERKVRQNLEKCLELEGGHIENFRK